MGEQQQPPPQTQPDLARSVFHPLQRPHWLTPHCRQKKNPPLHPFDPAELEEEEEKRCHMLNPWVCEVASEAEAAEEPNLPEEQRAKTSSPTNFPHLQHSQHCQETHRHHQQPRPQRPEGEEAEA